MDLSGGNSTFTHGLIGDNHSVGDGGGFKLRHSSPTLVGGRVSNNYFENHGGGIWVSDLANVTLDGTSVCENTAAHFFSDPVDWSCNGEGDDEIGTDGPSTGCEGVLTGDLGGDGVVDGVGLGIVLGDWGPCTICDSGLAGDGSISGAD